IVNSNGTFDISNGGAITTTQTITTLDLRGATISTGTNTLSTNNTITALATSTTGSTIASNTISGNLALGANTTINTAADDGATLGLNISAPISGAFALTKVGAGTLTLNAAAANTYTGTTTVNTGTLQLGDTGGVAIPGALTVGDSLGGQGASKADVVTFLASNQIQQTAAVIVANSGLLNLNGFNNTIG